MEGFQDLVLLQDVLLGLLAVGNYLRHVDVTRRVLAALSDHSKATPGLNKKKQSHDKTKTVNKSKMFPQKVSIGLTWLSHPGRCRVSVEPLAVELWRA